MQLLNAMEVYLGTLRKKATRRNYEGRLRPFVEAIGPSNPVSVITPIMIQHYVNGLINQEVRFEDHPKRPTEKGELSPHTINGIIKCIRRFFNWCIEMGEIQMSPAVNINQLPVAKEISPERMATEDEVMRMLKVLEGHLPRLIRDYAIIYLLYDTGMRRKEAAYLRLSNLNLGQNEILIVEAKGDHPRYVFPTDACVAALRRWIAVRPRQAEHDYLFCACRVPYTRLADRALSKRVYHASKAANIGRPLHSHHLRHLWITRQLQGGMDIKHVSAAVGATPEVIWSHYQHVSKASVKAAVLGAIPPEKREETIINLDRFKKSI